MTTYTIKDSGKRHEFETGSRRDTEEGKLDWTLLPHVALARLVRHLELGLAKYGRHNWTKGQSMSRAERSLYRHWVAYLAGEDDEDHLAALVFNACVLLDHEQRIQEGRLPRSLDDRDEHRVIRKFAAPFEQQDRCLCGDPSDCENCNGRN